MLVTDISDLGCAFSPFHQIYTDACDLGLTVVGKTGAEVDYFIDEEKRDAEGDLQVIILKPTPESLRRTPLARGTSVHVLND